jgi:hypothetical protein
MSLDIPVLATVDPAALVLTLAAVVALFHFNIGIIPVLAACSAAGVLHFLAVGTIRDSSCLEVVRASAICLADRRHLGNVPILIPGSCRPS